MRTVLLAFAVTAGLPSFAHALPHIRPHVPAPHPAPASSLPRSPVPEDSVLARGLMGRGVSQELAQYRRDRIRDVRYALTLDVTGRDTARGNVRISFERVSPGDVILDFRGPRAWNIRANGKPVPGVTNNGAHIQLPGSAFHAGGNSVELDFGASIAPAGASVIRFHDATDGADYLYTLLVPADANQLFPCFDQPDLKARTTLRLVVPGGWNAVANGVLTRNDVAGGRNTLAFGETKPISTYLIAFAAGPWTRVTRSVAGRSVTMYVRASRAKEVESDSLIAANARAVGWLAEYFGVAYPWPKLDFVLAPAFPFGGMEHPGAIFYSENTFIFKERPTRTQILAREATIYHEVAHQWFGDLVTMRWFDDLWLKEGFATYMAAKMQAALEPSSNAWETFYLRNKPLAYSVDRTEGTTPIWQQLDNLDQAKSNYGAIVYNKAPGVLKQLNYLVGDSAFRLGVHGFLTQHAYANATWRDLLGAIGIAANRSLATWGNEYILRPGIPVIEQEATIRDGAIQSLALRQSAVRNMSGPGPWPIRTEVLLHYADGQVNRMVVDLTSATTAVRLPGPARAPDFVYANAGDNAYALVVADSASARWLESNVETLTDPLLRAMAWDALWELVRRGTLRPAEYLGIADRELPSDGDEQIVAAQLAHVSRAARAYLTPSEAATVFPNIEATLLRMATDSARSFGIRKANLDALVRIARTPESLSYLDALLDSASAAGAPLRAPTRWGIVTRLLATGHSDAARRFTAESKRDSTSEGKRYAFIADAARPDGSVKREYFTRYLSDSTLNEDWATASLGAFNELNQQALTLEYLKPALDTLPWLQRNRRIFFIGSWLDGFLGGQTSPEALTVVRTFLAQRNDLGKDLRAKVLQAVDEMERTVAIREGAATSGIKPVAQ
ncbi:MAG: M1 family metallopeptidase [Gemmatimonadaceae bacterium]